MGRFRLAATRRQRGPSPSETGLRGRDHPAVDRDAAIAAPAVVPIARPGHGHPADRAIVIAIMAVSMPIGLLVVPLYAGYLQVIDATARGLPARATCIFNPYRQGGALRLIGYGLALALITSRWWGSSSWRRTR
jgi:hypothetical protein